MNRQDAPEVAGGASMSGALTALKQARQLAVDAEKLIRAYHREHEFRVESVRAREQLAFAIKNIDRAIAKVVGS